MKKLFAAFLALILIPIIGGCTISNNNKNLDTGTEFSVGISDVFWENVNLEYSGFSNKDEFIAEAMYYIESISEYVSRPNWFTVYKEKHGNDYIVYIEYRLTDRSSHVESDYLAYLSLIPNLYLNKELFEYRLAPIAHETTHIILPFYSSLSLREGLASHCQDIFGNPSVFNCSINPHDCAGVYMRTTPDDFNKIFSVIGTTDNLQESYAAGDSRKVFYILSHSFTNYLIETYGIDKFMELYDSDNLINDYEVFCGKNIEDIKSEWRGHLEYYSDSITYEELQSQISEILSLHNYP